MNPQQNADNGQFSTAQPSPFAPPVIDASQSNATGLQQGTSNPSDPLAVLKLPSNVAVTDNNTTPTIPQSNILSADDADLIEKEWVNKAKQIVDHYKDDPYTQSKEMTIFRADYMKKRYNRTIKLGE